MEKVLIFIIFLAYIIVNIDESHSKNMDANEHIKKTEICCNRVIELNEMEKPEQFFNCTGPCHILNKGNTNKRSKEGNGQQTFERRAERTFYLGRFPHSSRRNPSRPRRFGPGKNPSVPSGFEPGWNPSGPSGFGPGWNPSGPSGFGPGWNPSGPSGFGPGWNPSGPSGFGPGWNPSGSGPSGFGPGWNPSGPDGFGAGWNPDGPSGFGPGWGFEDDGSEYPIIWDDGRKCPDGKVPDEDEPDYPNHGPEKNSFSINFQESNEGGDDEPTEVGSGEKEDDNINKKKPNDRRDDKPTEEKMEQHKQKAIDYILNGNCSEAANEVKKMLKALFKDKCRKNKDHA